MSFGRHLRGLREAAGLSRPELARRAAVPVSTLRNWGADRGFPACPPCCGWPARWGCRSSGSPGAWKTRQGMRRGLARGSLGGRGRGRRPD
jgi:hypothetical protein